MKNYEECWQSIKEGSLVYEKTLIVILVSDNIINEALIRLKKRLKQRSRIIKY